MPWTRCFGIAAQDARRKLTLKFQHRIGVFQLVFIVLPMATILQVSVARGGSMKRTFIILVSISTVLLISTTNLSQGQTLGNGLDINTPSESIATPRPINPAAGTTNPSARATQTLNPYLGSTPDPALVPGVLQLSLEDAVARGLKYNLGLIDSQQSDAGVRAQRRRALSLL
jgi:hypothetical protein